MLNFGHVTMKNFVFADWKIIIQCNFVNFGLGSVIALGKACSLIRAYNDPAESIREVSFVQTLASAVAHPHYTLL